MTILLCLLLCCYYHVWALGDTLNNLQLLTAPVTARVTAPLVSQDQFQVHVKALAVMPLSKSLVLDTALGILSRRYGLTLSEELLTRATFERRLRLFFGNPVANVSIAGARIDWKGADSQQVAVQAMTDDHGRCQLQFPLDNVLGHASVNVTLLDPSMQPLPMAQFTVHFAKQSEGWSLISDIDDTIRQTGMLKLATMFQSTFVDQEYTAVPNMAAFYRQLNQQYPLNVHYLSGSLMPLLEDLNRFLQREGFPAGSMTLGQMTASMFRDAFPFITDLYNYKVDQAVGLLRQYPQRQFLLIGDSGQQDPEVYAHLYWLSELVKEDTPLGTIACILIRRVSGVDARKEASKNDPDRFSRVFAHVPRHRWRIYSDANELMHVRDFTNGCYTTE